MSSKMHFDASFSFEKSIHVIRDLLPFFLEPADDLFVMFERRDWEGLSSYSIDFTRDDWDPHVLSGVYQALAFFSKNASLPLAHDVRAVALAKFLESEEICRATNNRFRNRSKPFSEGGLDAGLIFRVQRKIAGILGPLPGIDRFTFGFGPGANVGLRRFTSVRRKISAVPTCTAGAWKYVKHLQECSPHWATLQKGVVPCNSGKYASVPKNAKTDRSILVEPLLNSYLQKGVGSYIRQRLLGVGVNLRDQTLNQRLAREGSITGEWATIDLASASDTISREVVKELLPCDWWLLLEDLRSQFALLPGGREIYLQKFSSMGNGFTFELESLIFFAIASVASEDFVQVYGDDIVVRSCHYSKVVAALTHFGFTTNVAKSFGTGRFRESCGRDYYGGVQIRPCYVKGRLSVKELFRLHNFFVRNHREDVAKCVLKHVPARFMVFGPDGFGDGHLLGDHHRRRPAWMSRRGWGGYAFRTFQSQPLVRREALDGDYGAFIYLSTQQVKGYGEDSGVPPSVSMFQERGGGRYCLRSVYTHVLS
jgi:hypothetical protein